MNYLIQQTETFAQWHGSLKDLRAKTKTAVFRRIDRAASGNLGDCKPVGNGVSEMRINMGTGYRIYFTIRQRIVIILLAGGDKATQQADIQRVIALAKRI